MNRKALVHMLPVQGHVERFPLIGKSKNGKLVAVLSMKDASFELEPYDLHFTTDEEPKDGDKVIAYCDNQVWEFRKEPCPLPHWGNAKTCRKIVATTNRDLWRKNWMQEIYEPSSFVPKIPTDFIEAYVKAEGKITAVMLEYDEIGEEIDEEENVTHLHRLKLDNNGTVIIKSVDEDDKLLEDVDDLIAIARANGSAILPGLLVAREKIRSWKTKKK